MSKEKCESIGLDWNRRGNRSAPNYKNPYPLVITVRLPLYPDQTLGDHIKKWRLERGLFQVDLAKRIGVSERTIVNWERGRTKPIKQNFERLEKILGDFPSSSFEIDKREFIKGRQWNDLSRQI